MLIYICLTVCMSLQPRVRHSIRQQTTEEISSVWTTRETVLRRPSMSAELFQPAVVPPPRYNSVGGEILAATVTVTSLTKAAVNVAEGLPFDDSSFDSSCHLDVEISADNETDQENVESFPIWLRRTLASLAAVQSIVTSHVSVRIIYDARGNFGFSGTEP